MRKGPSIPPEPTDVALNGSGLLCRQQRNVRMNTPVRKLSLTSNGNLVTANGLKVMDIPPQMGRQYQCALAPINIPVGQVEQPHHTTVNMTTNLDATSLAAQRSRPGYGYDS